MKIEIESIAISVPWWLIISVALILLKGVRIRRKAITKAIKDWIKDD
jgi:hypothetical protein